MKERLDMFMKLENLTPAKFAASLGIERSGLSHLLAGRNKPSYDFITKMLTAYPRLNPEWLLLGKGKVYKDDTASVALPVQTPAQTHETLFPPSDFSDEELQDGIIEDIPEKMIEPDLFAEMTEQANNMPVTSKNTNPQPSENLKFEQSSPTNLDFSHSQDCSAISKIIILFKDGSYEIR